MSCQMSFFIMRSASSCTYRLLRASSLYMNRCKRSIRLARFTTMSTSHSPSVLDVDDSRVDVQSSLSCGERDLQAMIASTTAHYNAGEYHDALSAAKSAVTAAERIYGAVHPVTASAYNNAALMNKLLQEYDDAADMYTRALNAYRDTVGATHKNYLTTMHNLAILYRLNGRTDDAVALFNESIETRRRLFGDDDIGLASSLHNLAAIYSERKEYDAAIGLQRTAIRTMRRAHGSEHPHTATAMNNLAVTYKLAGQIHRSITAFTNNRWEYARDRYRQNIPTPFSA